MRTGIADVSMAAATELLRQRQVSPVELLAACLKRIEERNEELNAFITVTADSALQQAQEAEREIQQGGWRGPLHGIPIALKDLIDTAGILTTAGSAVFRHRIPEQDAEVVRHLKNAGAVIVGKTNLHEFAYGGSSVISHFGPVRNARDPERIAGGSSGGSATAVAAGMCFAAIGTDTAASIREPAAFCGVVGLKPTYGLVSARGVIPLSWSYDHVGPITRTVEDAALVLQAIAGYDAADIYSREIAVGDYAAAVGESRTLPFGEGCGTPGKHYGTEGSGRPLRVGVAREFFFSDMDAGVSEAMDRALKVIAGFAAEMSEVVVPVEADRTVSNCESWTYHRGLVERHAELYQPTTLERIRAGESVSAAEYVESVQRLKRVRRESGRLFESVDVIVTPTAPLLPPRVDDLLADLPGLRKRELKMMRNTRPFNVLGIPAISIPCGTAQNPWIGLQIAGPEGGEDVVLAFAREVERRLL